MTDTQAPITGLLLKADWTVEEKTYGGYEDLKSAVDGWIEGIDPLRDEYEFTWRGYVNEEGWIKNDPRPNLAASMVLAELGWTGGQLAGDVVIVGPTDEEGWDTSLSEKVKAQIVEAYAALNYLADGFVTPEVED